MSRYYKKGYRTARNFVRIDNSSVDDVKEYLDKVYEKSVRSIALPLEEDSEFAKNSVKDLENKIEVLRKEEENLRNKMHNPNFSDLESDVKDIIEKIEKEVDVLVKKIDALKLGLISAEKEHIQETSKENPVKIISGTAKSLKSVKERIDTLTKKFTPLIGSLLMVLVDYGIAVFFFQDLFEGTKGELILGWVLPLILTVLCMVLMHMVVERIKRWHLSGRTIDLMTSIGSGLFLLIILVAVFVVRTQTGSEDLVVQIFIWLLFVALVLAVGYRLNKDEQDATSIITIPLLLTANILAGAVVCVLWLFESLYIVLMNNKGTTRSSELWKNIEHIKTQIDQHKQEKAEKERQLIEIPENNSKYRLQHIERIKEEAKKLYEPELRKTKSLILDAESSILKHKNSERELKKNLSDLRQGSNDGAMKEVHKKFKSIKQ